MVIIPMPIVVVLDVHNYTFSFSLENADVILEHFLTAMKIVPRSSVADVFNYYLSADSEDSERY